MRHQKRPAHSSAKKTWSRADLHLHTSFSDGMMTPEETVDIITTRTSLQVIAITDHDTADGAWIAQDYARSRGLDLDVIIGQEVTTGDGDVLALFIKQTLPVFSSADAAIAAIHKQGGLAVAAHPFAWGWELQSVGKRILDLRFDAIETRHGCPLYFAQNWYAHFLNQRGQRLPETGASDSHIPYTAGEAFTWFPGRSAEDLHWAMLSGEVRPGGPLWTAPNLLRVLPVILRHGWPEPVHKPKMAPLER